MVSVIIAVYNTERYLRECLDSLLSQTYSNWEAWCIDDGSTDASSSILDSYAKRDSRINVVHLQENKGLAFARNIGVEKNNGNYIMFLDSDDWLLQDSIEKARKIFLEHPYSDCVLFKCIYVYSDREEFYPSQYFECISGTEAALRSLSWKNIHGIYMVKAEIHKKYLYDTSAKWYSDENTTFQHYFASKEVRCTDGVYKYRMHDDSITHKVSIHQFDKLDAKDSQRKMLEEMNASIDCILLQEEVRWRSIIDCYMYYYNNRRYFTKAEKKTILQRLRNSWSTTNRKRLPKTLIKKFGYKPMLYSWHLFRLQEELYFTMRKFKM